MNAKTYDTHLKKWNGCTACDLHRCRKRMVFGRGRMANLQYQPPSFPCQVLMVGEAPGLSEDVHGKPFIGPAGKLLDTIIDRAIPPEVTVNLTNLVSCIPIGDEGTKTAEPPDESIKACAPRLREFIELCQPRLLVCVGKLSAEHLMGGGVGKKLGWRMDHVSLLTIAIVHPAAILRANVAQKSQMVQRCFVKLANAVSKIL